MNRPVSGLVILTVAAALLGTACEEKRSSSKSTLSDAGAAGKYVTEDPKLAKALQAVASGAPTQDKGPPPDGIFPPGAADRRHPKGMPTKVDLVSDGDDPRISLAGSSDTVRSSYGIGGLELGMQMGPRVALPTIDLTLSFGPARKDEGGSDWLVAQVKKALTAREQYGELPPGTAEEIATLAGTELRVKVDGEGLESDTGMRLAGAARPELDRLAQSAVEALALATVPLPPKPVGVGAQWIAETRMAMGGLDVIAYRAYRVKSIEGDRVRLSLDVNGYSATENPPLVGVPKGAALVQMRADAQGEMELVKGEMLARKSDVQQRILLVFQAPGTQAPAADPLATDPDQARQAPAGGMMTAQIVSQATLVRGEDLRDAMKQP